jgi:molybdopterin-guanine dinucleotide biosynthesis protein A
VVTALTHFADARAVVVVSCDLPLLSAATVRGLLDALGREPQVMAAVAVTDRLQPLCVAWRPVAVDVVEAAFHQGERRLHAVLRSLPLAEVLVDPQDLLNVNAARDLRH